MLTGHRRAVTDLAFVGDGSARLLSLADGGELRLWRLPRRPQDQLLVQVVRGHGASLSRLAVAGRRAVTASADGALRAWRLLADLPRAPRSYSTPQAERISGLRLRSLELGSIAPADFAELRQHVRLVDAGE